MIYQSLHFAQQILRPGDIVLQYFVIVYVGECLEIETPVGRIP